MNVNFEAIEKECDKSKKDIIKVNLDLKGIKNLENYITDLEQSKYVLDELERWLYLEKEQGYEVYYKMALNDILDKIQELKKEMK